jgi:hypothetical protein
MSDTRTTRARRLVFAKLHKDELEQQARTANETFDDLEQAFWENMHERNESSVTLDLGEPLGKVQFVPNMTIRCNVVDKEAAMKSIREMGLEEALIDPLTGIRRKPLNDYMKDWIRSGATIPEGLDFSVTRYLTISIKPSND